MATDPVGPLLAAIDRPVAPRPEFAEALLGRLLADLEREDPLPAPGAPAARAAVPARAPTVGARAGTGPRRRAPAPGWLATAALLVLTLAAGFAALRLRPDAPADRPAAPNGGAAIPAPAPAEWSSTLLLRADLDALPPGSVGARLDRWTFPSDAGAWRTVAPSLPGLLYVEAGRLDVTVDARATLARAASVKPARAAVPAGNPIPLRAGDLLVVPAGARVALRTDVLSPPAVLVVVLAPPDELGTAAFGPPGVAVETLGTGPLTGVPGGPGTVALRRIAVAPGAALPAEVTAGSDLFVVEAGIAGLRTGRDGPEVTRSAGAAAASAIPAGTRLALRNAGDEPLALLRLTVAPATDDTGVSTP